MELSQRTAAAGSLPLLTLAQLQALVALLIVTGKATEADLAPWRLLVSFISWWECETGRSAWPLPAVEVVQDMVARLPALATDEAVAQAAAELGRIVPLLAQIGR